MHYESDSDNPQFTPDTDEKFYELVEEIEETDITESTMDNYPDVRLAPIVQNDDMGPGAYMLNHSQQTKHVQTNFLGKCKSERFGLTLYEKDRIDLGPGKYHMAERLVPAFKNKPTAPFTSKAPKDGFFEELNKKVFAKRSRSQQEIRQRKGPINGNIHEVLDFNEETDYRKIKPDFINGTNVGPGSYNTLKYTGVNSNREQGKNRTFNCTAPRFYKGGNESNNNIAPTSYDHMRANFLFLKAKTTFNKKICNIPFDTVEKKLKVKPSKVPGAGAYETKPTFVQNLDSKNAIHKIDSDFLKKNSTPRFLVPNDVYENADLGPGFYNQMHDNLKINENKPMASFQSLYPRLPHDPCMDKLYGKYKIDMETIEEQAAGEKLNKFAFNKGTDRFHLRNEKANILFNKQNKAELKDLIDTDPADIKNN